MNASAPDPYAHECQVDGCHERALPWGWEYDYADLTIIVRLCRRHELEVVGRHVRPVHTSAEAPS